MPDRSMPANSAPRAHDPRVIDALLDQLTLDEKLSLIHASETFRNGNVPRLGIPSLVMSDGPHGVRQEVLPGTFQPDPDAEDATTYLPTGLTVAATWDAGLAEAAGRVLGSEARARGKDVILGPGVNLLRTPLCGRNFEYLGEDPLLAGTMAAAFIRGVQSQGVAACVKHFACNNQELDRRATDATVSERALRECYLPAFKAAVEAGVLTVMGAYNRVNGSWATHHPQLTRAILKQEWGFPGVVMSDWGSTHADAEALRSGLDLEMGTNLGRWNEYHFAERLREAIDNGRADIADLDDAVRRVLRVLHALGAFEPHTRPAGSRGTPEQRATALSVAEAGIVVLSHDGTLPLDASRVRSLAVIGANADRAHAGGGGSSGVRARDEITPLRGLRERLPDASITHVRAWPDVPLGAEPIPARHLDAVDAAGIGGWLMEVWDNPRFLGPPIRTSTVPEPVIERDSVPAPDLDALGWSIRWSACLRVPATGRYTLYATGMDNWQVLRDGAPLANLWGLDAPHTEVIDVELVRGDHVRLTVQLNPKAPHAEFALRWIEPGIPKAGGGLADALLAAEAADAVIVVAGLDHRFDTEGVDRAGYGLPDAQDAVIAAVLKRRPDTIVVLTGGAPVALPWVGQARNLLWAGYGGECSGTAIARVVLGDIAPRGRLPFTWWGDLADCPAHRVGEYREGICEYREDLFIGYRDADANCINPLFPFGHGLGWGAIEYHNLALSLDPRHLTATLDLTNPGPREAVEVVQLYVEPPATTVARPRRELKAFTSVPLAPGQSKPIALRVPFAELAWWEPGHGWRTDPGVYRVAVGASSRDLRLHADIELPPPA